MSEKSVDDLIREIGVVKRSCYQCSKEILIPQYVYDGVTEIYAVNNKITLRGARLSDICTTVRVACPDLELFVSPSGNFYCSELHYRMLADD